MWIYTESQIQNPKFIQNPVKIFQTNKYFFDFFSTDFDNFCFFEKRRSNSTRWASIFLGVFYGTGRFRDVLRVCGILYKSTYISTCLKKNKTIYIIIYVRPRKFWKLSDFKGKFIKFHGPKKLYITFENRGRRARNF